MIQNSQMLRNSRIILKTLVSKTAKEAIAGLTLNEVNYKEAIRLLQARFGNKERIISKHMEALLNVEAVASQGNTAALRALYDKVEIHTRELQTLGVTAEAYNCLLPSVLMKKLPNELCLLISRRISEDEWNLDRIMKELSDELKARERTAIDRKRLNEEGLVVPRATTSSAQMSHLRQPRCMRIRLITIVAIVKVITSLRHVGRWLRLSPESKLLEIVVDVLYA